MYLTNYGRSTYRIIIAFFVWNILWSLIYYIPYKYFDISELQSSAFLDVQNMNYPTAALQSTLFPLLVVLYPDILGISNNFFWTFCVLVHLFGCYILLAAFIARFENMVNSLSP